MSTAKVLTVRQPWASAIIYAGTAIARHTVLVMAALAICAITAALLRDRTDTQAPPPVRPDQPPPPDPGMIPLTVPEIQRLLAAALAWPSPPGHADHWSGWTRRHQARSRWYHQRARLARNADITLASKPTREEKIADAVRAAPAYIADSATVVDWDMTTVLREGSPDWICVPTPPGKPQPAPMCLDPTWVQWLMELRQGKTPTIDRIGISYMLMGEVGADFDDPLATQSPEGKDWYHAGPHVMFVFPEGTGRILKGLAHDTTSGLPYVRPIPGAEPLLVVPVAKPGERACGCPSECSCGCNG